MGIAKKGTRRICVDDVPYRWIARELSPGVRIIVQAEGRAGSVLVLRTDQNFAVQYVKPAEVAEAIQAARAAGWEPRRSGPPFEVSVWLYG